MRKTIIAKVASVVISSVMIQTAVAGHAVGIGVGPRFGEGGVGGGIFDALFGGDSHSASASGSTPRISLSSHPTFGQPVIVRSSSRITTSPVRLATRSHPRNPSRYRTITAVQRNLTKLGYYHASVDGRYGRATRHAVARYQTHHHLAVTGSLTRQMLQLLGVSPSSRTETGSELGSNRTRELTSRVE